MNFEDIVKDLKSNFELFTNEIEKLFSNNVEILDNLTLVKNEVLNNEKISERLLKLNEKINLSEDIFSLFLKSKIKLFSSKMEETNDVSLSLFGSNLPLKVIFNNREKKVKSILWKYLQLFYLLVEHSKEESNLERIKNITELLSRSEKNQLKDEDTKDLTDRVKKDILNVQVNDTTNNMIEDIVGSFQTSLDANSENPFDCILEITQKISEKYHDKIDSGEIELDKMMTSITETIPGIEGLVSKNEEKPKEKIIIDENFSTDNVVLGDKEKTEQGGFNLSGMMKMMNGMNGENGGPNLKGLMDVMGKLNSVKDEDDALKLKEEMDSYLENELGVDVTKLNETINDNTSKSVLDEVEIEEVKGDVVEEVEEVLNEQVVLDA